MIKPPNISNPDDFDSRGKIFDTPLMTRGNTWLPLTEIGAAGILTHVVSKRTPARPWYVQWLSGTACMAVILGSEWGHNLAHTFAAKSIGKPVDAIRINWGMPLLHYETTNAENVTPLQHIIRALGGPIFNALLVPLAWVFKTLTKTGSIARDIADSFLGINLFLAIVSLLPIPGIDGGPILKWSMVESGKTRQEADKIIRKTNWGVSAAGAVGSAIAFKKKKTFWGFVFAMFSGLGFLIASGLLKEHE